MTLAGINPCLSVHCQVGEECDINKFGIARCECPPPCEPIMRTVCGDDGRTYESLCEMRRASCTQKKLIEVKHAGSCGKIMTVEMWLTNLWYYKSLIFLYKIDDRLTGTAYEGWNFNFGNTPLDWIQELLEWRANAAGRTGPSPTYIRNGSGPSRNWRTQ